MIEVRNYRSNGGSEILLSNPERPLDEAIRQLLVSELAYGGQVSGSTETSLEVKTEIMGCHDRTVFSGPLEEMKQLFIAAVLWRKAEKKVSFDDWWKEVSEKTDGVPLLVKMLGPHVNADLVWKELAKMLEGGRDALWTTLHSKD
jgi:hypothetical protein